MPRRPALAPWGRPITLVSLMLSVGTCVDNCAAEFLITRSGALTSFTNRRRITNGASNWEPVCVEMSEEGSTCGVFADSLAAASMKRLRKRDSQARHCPPGDGRDLFVRRIHVCPELIAGNLKRHRNFEKAFYEKRLMANA